MRDFGGDPSAKRFMDFVSSDDAVEDDLRCAWRSNDPCDALVKGLSLLESERLVVGHTPQIVSALYGGREWTLNVTSDCDRRLWRIDTAMSTAFGGLHNHAKEHVVTALRITKVVNEDGTTTMTTKVLRTPYVSTGRVNGRYG